METGLFSTLYLLIAILWIWALADWFRSKFKSLTAQLIWLVVIVAFPVVGSILYFQFRRKFTEGAGRKFQPAFRRG